MPTRFRSLLAACAYAGFALLLAPSAAPCVQDGEPESEPGEKAHHVQPPVVTTHELWVGNERQNVEVHAGYLPLAEENGDLLARVFHIAYIAQQPADAPPRPVTFVFNGGPGSSSVWLHLGGVGPWRVDMGEDGLDGNAGQAPFTLAENPHSLLGVSDLVFLDPVSTGHSRAALGVDPGRFHGLEGDADSVAAAIRLWTQRNARWDSPKFLCGESYGTTRAAALSKVLQRTQGIELEGIVLISAVLDFATLRFDPSNDLVYALLLPSYGATAAYHGRIPVDLEKERDTFLAEVETFALETYLPALVLGNRLPEERRAALAERLAGCTGLSTEELLECNLRPSLSLFTKSLLRESRRTVGRLDSRFLGRDRDAAGESYEYDPSYAAILGPFTAAQNHLMTTKLGWSQDLPYEILTGRVQPWTYPQGRYPDVTQDLRETMARNPHLQVFVAEGIFDLATPYFAIRHTLSHLGWEADMAERFTIRRYDAGHMMYIRPADNLQLGTDLASFYSKALGR